MLQNITVASNKKIFLIKKIKMIQMIFLSSDSKLHLAVIKIVFYKIFNWHNHSIKLFMYKSKSLLNILTKK